MIDPGLASVIVAVVSSTALLNLLASAARAMVRVWRSRPAADETELETLRRELVQWQTVAVTTRLVALRLGARPEDLALGPGEEPLHPLRDA